MRSIDNFKFIYPSTSINEIKKLKNSVVVTRWGSIASEAYLGKVPILISNLSNFSNSVEEIFKLNNPMELKTKTKNLRRYLLSGRKIDFKNINKLLQFEYNWRFNFRNQEYSGITTNENFKKMQNFTKFSRWQHFLNKFYPYIPDIKDPKKYIFYRNLFFKDMYNSCTNNLNIKILKKII